MKKKLIAKHQMISMDKSASVGGEHVVFLQKSSEF